VANDTYAIIGSDGSLERYPDPYANVTAEMLAEAEKAEAEIIKRRNRIEQSFMEMSFLLDDFDRNEYYRARGYASLWEWAEDSTIEIGRRVALDLLRVVREVIPVLTKDNDFETAVKMLAEAKISKTRTLLPLLSDGMEDEFLDLMERAPDMTWKDVRREVKMLRKGDDGDKMPAVFKAKVRRGEKVTRYQVSVLDGQKFSDCGVLMIPNEYAPRWNERFTDTWIEYELEG